MTLILTRPSGRGRRPCSTPAPRSSSWMTLSGRRARAVAERPGAAGRIWPRRGPTLDGWDAAIAEVRRLAALRPDVERYVDLRDRLAEVAPEWAAQIEAGRVPAGVRRGLPGRVGVAAGADLVRRGGRQRRPGRARPAGRATPGRRSAGCTAELVVASAWLEVSRSLDDRRRAALADWTTALRKIGKGTGRNAAAWQAHAQRAMESAVEAVPVWVMSVDRAIEQFAGGAHFDVVIVDEASQADLFALPVLALAERAVVVGDDQQIGPQLGFVGVGVRPDPQPSRRRAVGRALRPGVIAVRPRGAPVAGADPADRALPVRAADHRVLVEALLRPQDHAAAGGPAVAGADPHRLPARTACASRWPAYGDVNVAEAEALVGAGRRRS